VNLVFGKRTPLLLEEISLTDNHWSVNAACDEKKDASA
jgi:hypothetical protein